MADIPLRQVQRRVDDAAGGPPPKPQYAGLFIEPDIPPLDDEPE
ncbi:hypothetical protein ACFVZR_07815 [Streptomyces sp. NPDC058316]